MPLTELEPEFIRLASETGSFHRVATLAEAQGLLFLCPVCYQRNGGPVGAHSVICWSRSRGVPDGVHPAPGRWKLDGDDFLNLTLNGDGGSRSVALIGGCQGHFFVTAGQVHP